MFCQNCGIEIPEGAKFCVECGAPVESASPVIEQKPSLEQKTKSRPKSNVLGMISGIIVIVSLFLPFVSVNILGTPFSESLMDGASDEPVAIGFIVIIFGCVLLAALGRNIPCIIAGILSAWFFWETNAAYERYTSELDELTNGAIVQNGLGFYMLLIGSMGLILAGVLGIIHKKDK